jgi:hypothetical protein
VVVGTPKPAQGAPPPPLNSKLPDEKPVAPQAPPNNVVEVPALVQPGNGAPAVPLAPGPDAMVRTPDGATTLGTQHLPSPDGPLPMPGAGPAAVPGMPVVPGPPLAPGTPPAGMAPVIPVVPPPLVALAAPAAPAMPPPAVSPVPPAGPVPPPVASSPADLPGMPHHRTPSGPLVGEQFGPLTVTPPGAPR